MSSASSSNNGAAWPGARSDDGAQPLPLVAGRRRWLLLAVALFVGVKLAWALVPAFVMGAPRLGDDALVYLWSGASSVLEPRLERPAIRDIIRFRQVQDSPSPELEFQRARVTMRTTGVTASPVSLLAGALLHAGVNHRLAFALVESAVAIVLALGIAWCLSQVVGGPAAALTLAVLAFAILPNQGLHYLIGSVFALGCGMLLWATVLKHPRRWLLVLVVAWLMLLTHPIGLVYVLVAAALIAGSALLRRRIEMERIPAMLALAAAVPLWMATSAALGVRAPVTAGMGGFSIGAIAANMAGLVSHVKTLALTQPILLALVLAGLVLAFRRRREDPDVFLLAGVLLGVVVSTVVVDIPGYPGELPSRALVALVVACTAAGAAALLRVAGPSRRRWIAAGLALTILTQLPLFMRYGMDNINSRHQVYDADLLRQEVAALPPTATVVWPDTDLSMMAALLVGADRLRAIPYPMLAGAESLRREAAGVPNLYVATSVPERLSGTSTLWARSLRPRFYGYDFAWYRRVTLRAIGPATLPRFLRLQGPRADVRVRSDAGRPCELAPAEVQDWYRIAGCEGEAVLHIESASSRLRLTGLGVARPDPVRPWPWGEAGLHLRAEPRKGGEAPELDFSLAYLLGERTAQAFASALGPLQVVSSRSGIVWLQPRANSSPP